MIAEAGLVAEFGMGAFGLRSAELDFLIHHEPPRGPAATARASVPNAAHDRLMARNSSISLAMTPKKLVTGATNIRFPRPRRKRIGTPGFQRCGRRRNSP
jgi:hypothetical protein